MFSPETWQAIQENWMIIFHPICYPFYAIIFYIIMIPRHPKQDHETWRD